MKKILLGIVVILFLAFGYLGWRYLGVTQNFPKPPVQNVDFSASGNIVKNNPGMKAEVWYLVYEKPGNAALSSELVFDGNSQCLFGEQTLDCNNLKLNNGSVANVVGRKVNNGVLVSKLVADPGYYIQVDAPKSGEAASSSIRISGRARGYWYFEASFPVKLVTKDGAVITSTFMEAKSDWMTENYVPFDKTIRFSVPTVTDAYIVLANDNPSGLPENSKEVRIPVVLQPGFKTVNLYYYNANNDKDQNGNILCSKKGVVIVERQISISSTPLKDTIDLLLKGNLSAEEKASGVSTEFPLTGVRLTSAVINNGVATLTIEDPNNKTSGGSCRAAILWAQIEATAKQFPGVKQVRFLPEYLFQP